MPNLLRWIGRKSQRATNRNPSPSASAPLPLLNHLQTRAEPSGCETGSPLVQVLKHSTRQHDTSNICLVDSLLITTFFWQIALLFLLTFHHCLRPEFLCPVPSPPVVKPPPHNLPLPPTFPTTPPPSSTSDEHHSPPPPLS